MARKPSEFSSHTCTFQTARDSGLVRAVVKHVCDGDTFDLLVDLGFGQYSYTTIRLRGLDTPEVRGEEKEKGYEAKDRVIELLLNHPVLARSFPDTSFGRSVGDVFLTARSFDLSGLEPLYVGTTSWYSLAEILRKEGHGE